jgi:RNA polymerase sigma factor (sigma-70 family)
MDDDVVLVQMVVAGNTEAFTRFYERHRIWVRAYLLRRGLTWSEAEDVTQEVFITLSRRANQFNPCLGAFTTWLGQIVYWRYADYWQEHGNDPIPMSDHLPEQTAPTEGSEIEREEVVSRLRECIDSLPTSLRQVILLGLDEARTGPQIASCLGIAVGTVESRRHEARRRLRTCLESHGVSLVGESL